MRMNEEWSSELLLRVFGVIISTLMSRVSLATLKFEEAETG